MDLLVVAVRVMLTVLFTASLLGIARERSLAPLRVAVQQWTSGNRLESAALTVALVAAEVLVLVLLTWPGGGAWGLGLAGLLLVGFTVVLRRGIRRGVRADCHCFGTSGRPADIWTLVRNEVAILLALVAFAATLAARSTWGSLPGAAESATPTPTVVAVVTGALVGLILSRTDDLAVVFSRSPARYSYRKERV